jgi:UDP-N-acetylmuramoyl-L-alanyl-D-glutamate--2,6-diaminopimelate ligase
LYNGLIVKRLVRKVIPNKLVNLLKHYPMAVLANIQQKFPSRRMKIIGVTGTDGKTTTVNMIYQLLKAGGKKVSMISTINAVIGDKMMDIGFHVTSPAANDVQRYIAEAKKAGSEYMVLEVTSHALDQFRFWGVHFDIGVITNITHEHLDYHKTFESYRQAKTKLVKNVKWAVLNRDDKNFKFLGSRVQGSGGRVISVSLHEKANLNLKRMPLKLKIPGTYNLSNALQAAAVGQLLGLDNTTIKKTLENFENLNGRMEEVKNNLGIKIYIDFAHTPNALEQSLSVLRKLRSPSSKLIAVFGSAGKRDVGKRALMGEIAAKLADLVVITAEDPRGELEKINQQLLEGIKKAGSGKRGAERVFVENDRLKAIEMAVNQLAKKGDIVGIFGKGHETSINLDGKKEIPWSDREVVGRALSVKQEV